MGITKKIELLAPARDLEAGRIAVDAGADAVYIGGPGFGARRAAGNSLEDVAALVRYARPFGVRVYATLNTLLFDDELDEARRVAGGLVDAGVDALIVQDMAFMRMAATAAADINYENEAPQVELHASTQTSNILPEDVAFLGQVGFRRVILERALTLDEIRAIRVATPQDVELEVFVHGAICVGYSGRCFLSRSIFGDKQASASLCPAPKSSHTPQYAAASVSSQASHPPVSDEKSVRSGNRGDCSQPCRLAWDLVDSGGNVVMKGKHLLSVRDLDLSARIGELIDAGVSSFKIEGRLKDASYVRNIVSHYRALIDRELAVRQGLERASVGVSVPDFTPDPVKSFTRGGTEYFFDGARRGGRRADGGHFMRMASFDTPKAMGEPVGTVGRVGCERTGNRFFTIENGEAQFAAGDGVCFMAGGELQGTNINRVEAERIYPNRIEGIAPGTKVYRNYDHAFVRTLERSRMKRRIGVEARVVAASSRVEITFTDETGLSVAVAREGTFETARDPAKMAATMREQLSRSGDTIFEVRAVEVADAVSMFVPVSLLAQMRREGLERLMEARMKLVPERRPVREDPTARFPRTSLTAAENVTNRLAERFWRDHGVTEIAPPIELRGANPGEAVMWTRYCIRREIDECLKEGSRRHGELFLKRGSESWRLAFDCEQCNMKVIRI